MQPKDLTAWKNLKPGSQVILKDARSLQANVNGVPYEVVRTIEIPEDRRLMTWVFIELTGPTDETRWLMVKVVDNNMDIRIYHRPEKFNAGNRADFIGRNERWIFQKPEDPDNYSLNDLVYTMDFEWDGFAYHKKAQHVQGADMAGEPCERPRPTGDFPQQLATVAEYIADEWVEVEGKGKAKPKNPEAVLLEIGPADDDNGGLIWLLIGRTLEVGDVDVLVAK